MRAAWRFTRLAAGTPTHWIQILGVPVGGSQPAGVGSGVPPAALRPLDKGNGAAGSSFAPGGTEGSKEERRHRLRRTDGSFISNPPEASEDWWWGRGGRLLGPGRAETCQFSATTTIGSAATTTSTVGFATTTTT